MLQRNKKECIVDWPSLPVRAQSKRERASERASSQGPSSFREVKVWRVPIGETVLSWILERGVFVVYHADASVAVHSGPAISRRVGCTATECPDPGGLVSRAMFGGGEDAAHPGGLRAAFPVAENGTEDKYYKKYNAILRRCSGVQKENEMLVNRVHLVKKMVQRLRRERRYLMEELDRRGDNYRSLPLTIAIEEDEKSFALPQTSSLPALGRPRSSGSSLNSRRQPQVKRERVERDTPAPNPKRPSNAFLHFCQEQREAATAHHLHQTGRMPDKKQLTRQLASRWNALPDDDKKMYVEKYERERERYSGDKTA